MPEPTPPGPEDRAIRVFYSFPHRIGAGRICDIAWHQVAGVAAAGIEVTAVTASVARPLPGPVRVTTTLARGRLRLPYRLVGQQRALRTHDRIAARRLEQLAGSVDLVHAWPSGALETLTRARRLGITTVLERPNAHTRYAYDVVGREAERLGVELPAGSEHAYDAAVLAHEEREFQLADWLLCPSEFVVRSFEEEGFASKRLLRHSYGFDAGRFHPLPEGPAPDRPFTVLFAGTAAVRKGLHFALEAWLRSSASRAGEFLVAGAFLGAYREKLAPLLAHSSVKLLGQRSDIPDLMRRSDVLVLPSLEEGSPLVAIEALASGCIPLVSDVCVGPCQHMRNSLVHRVADVDTLAEHLDLLHDDPALRAELRSRAIDSATEFTWEAAAERLVGAYRIALAGASTRP